MKVYKYSEKNAKKIIKSQVISRIPLFVVAGFGGIFIANSQNGGMIFNDSLLLILSFILIAGSLFAGFLIGINKGTKTLMQNIYRIKDNGIEWITPSGKSINIDFDKIDLHKTSKKGLLVKDQNQSILIPIEFDSYGEISNAILRKVK